MRQVDIDNRYIEGAGRHMTPQGCRILRFTDIVSIEDEEVCEALAYGLIIFNKYDPGQFFTRLVSVSRFEGAVQKYILKTGLNLTHNFWNSKRLMQLVLGLSAIFAVSFLTFPERPRSLSARPETGSLVAVPQDLQPVSLEGKFDSQRDPDGKLTLEDVAFGQASNRFSRVKGNPGYGYTSDTIWLRLQLRREGAWPESLYLNLLPVYVDEILVHVPQVPEPRQASDFRLIRLGDHFSTERPGRFLTSQLAVLDLPDAETAVIYIRTRSSGNLAIRGWVAGRMGVLDVMTARTILSSGLMTLTFCGALLNLIYWVQLRRSYFLSFAGLLAVNALYVVSSTGLLNLAQLGLGTRINDMVGAQIPTLICLVTVLFIRHQVATRRRLPRVDLLLRGVAAGCVLALAGPAFGAIRQTAAPVLLAGLMAFAFFTYYSLLLWWRYNKPGSLMAALAALIQFLFSGFIVMSALLGSGYDHYREYGHWFGVAAFSLLMALSLIQRARSLDQRKRERDELRLARKAERTARELVAIRTAELKIAKEQAEAALAAEKDLQAEQLRFVDVIRHQYQTPLAVIRANTATLARSLGGGDAANQERLSRIKAAVRDLVDVLDVSLQRSRVEGIAATPHIAGTTVADLVEPAIANYRSLFPERQIALRHEGMSGREKVAVDPDMLGIALANLLDNALKYSPASTVVSLCLSRSGRDLVIEVHDQGIGIPEKEQAGIGQRYFRASNAGAVQGTGLGLHLLGKIAKAHGGHFTIANRPEGGALARLTLPVLSG
jgi:signal transduction histidine kinase